MSSMYGSQDLGACVHSRPGDQEVRAWTFSPSQVAKALQWADILAQGELVGI